MVRKHNRNRSTAPAYDVSHSYTKHKRSGQSAETQLAQSKHEENYLRFNIGNRGKSQFLHWRRIFTAMSRHSRPSGKWIQGSRNKASAPSDVRRGNWVALIGLVTRLKGRNGREGESWGKTRKETDERNRLWTESLAGITAQQTCLPSGACFMRSLLPS